MRMTTLARGGAVSTAAVLALTLTSGPANADDGAQFYPDASASKSLSSVDAWGATPGKSAARTSAGAGITLTKVRAASGVLFRSGDNSFPVELTGEPGTSPGGAGPAKTTFTLRVNGKNHENVLYRFDEDFGPYANTKSGWGDGKAQILNTTVTYTDGTTSRSGLDSNVFYLRRATRTTASKPFKVTTYSPGTKIKFQASTFKVFKPSTGKYVSLGKIRLQYKKSGSWKTLKTIKLNSRGSGSYTYKAPTRTYRLYVPTTADLLGGVSGSVTG